MTIDDFVEIIKGQASTAGPSVKEPHIKAAVLKGARKVWYSYQWECRRKQATLTTTSAQEYTELPEDFKSVRGLVYRDSSTEGWQLDFMGEDRFDIDFPNSALYTSDTPRKMKIVYDDNSALWRAYFTPKPDAAYKLVMVYNSIFTDISQLDESLQDLVVVATWLFIHAPGDEKWIATSGAFKDALRDAIDNDRPAQVSIGAVKRARRFNVCEGGGEIKDDWYLDNSGDDY